MLYEGMRTAQGTSSYSSARKQHRSTDMPSGVLKPISDAWDEESNRQHRLRGANSVSMTLVVGHPRKTPEFVAAAGMPLFDRCIRQCRSNSRRLLHERTFDSAVPYCFLERPPFDFQVIQGPYVTQPCYWARC